MMPAASGISALLKPVGRPPGVRWCRFLAAKRKTAHCRECRGWHLPSCRSEFPGPKTSVLQEIEPGGNVQQRNLMFEA